MTFYIEEDEWWPVYTLEVQEDRSEYWNKYIPSQGISPDFVERYKRVMKEFNVLQDDLRQLWKTTPHGSKREW